MSRTLDYIALIVVFIGAVNWGLVGLFLDRKSVV